MLNLNRGFSRIFAVILAVFALASIGTSISFGQTNITGNWTTTTLTASVANTRTNFVNVASASSILAPGLNQPQGGLGSPTGGPNETGLYIDGELMRRSG